MTVNRRVDANSTKGSVFKFGPKTLLCVDRLETHRQYGDKKKYTLRREKDTFIRICGAG